MTTLQRFWDKVMPEPTSGCWLWDASGTPYGFFYSGKQRLAHRVSYELFNGPIEEGLSIDHVCNTPSCVNPAHLRTAELRENVLRGDGPPARNARKERCPRGHEYRYSESKRQRICLTCNRELQRKRRALAKSAP